MTYLILYIPSKTRLHLHTCKSLQTYKFCAVISFFSLQCLRWKFRIILSYSNQIFSTLIRPRMREMMICMDVFMDNERIHRQGCLSYHCLSNSFVAIYANLNQLIWNSVCLVQSIIFDYESYQTFKERD